MSSKNIRLILRIAHIVEGALIVAYIYSASLQASSVYSGFIQFVIVPLVIFSGIAMWQLPRYNKWRSSRKRMATAK